MENKVEETKVVEETTAPTAPTDDSSKLIAELNFENGKRRKENEALVKQLQEIRDNEATAKVQSSQDIEELKRFNAEQAKLLKAHDATVAKYVERDEKELEGLISKVPEDLKEEVSDVTLPLETRLRLARKLATSKSKNLDYRPPGEPPTETLEAQYDAAVKSKNMIEQLRLKREIHAAKG